MGQTQLTAAYRPQTFAQVVGQEAVTRILSRAAAEDKIAAAYMFSGTRGVGKTTVARIVAKAINCDQGPGAEPCNQCSYCRQITQGTSLDVVEVDGASHTGVDHVRKLTEEVNYAPLECRYKVVTIDEAHMLSRSAFNALLKTLEEPPAHAVFILATTEPHKFPATIVSRCQHHVFKRVDQKTLAEHMQAILDKEGIAYEPEALRVLARKGAGSVRDCLSLLSQILALGEGEIKAGSVQAILGLAGQEMMMHCVQALAERDCPALLGVVKNLLDNGLDIGFFLQDLASVWRNLFVLKQTGEQGIGLLQMPEEEARQWLAWAGQMSGQHIHAAWQMTLEGQKRVVSSPDPALALELLLMNLAFLPDLVSVEQARTGTSAPTEPSRPARPQPAEPKKDVSQPQPQEPSESRPVGGGANGKDWAGFLEYVRSSQTKGLPHLHLVQGELQGDILHLRCKGFLAQRLQDKTNYPWLQEQVGAYFGPSTQICIHQEEGENGQDMQQLKKKILEEPVVQEVLDLFEARIVDIQPRNGQGSEA